MSRNDFSPAAVSSGNQATFKVLSSKWDGLNPALIGVFYPVRRADSGSGWQRLLGKRTLSSADNFVVDDGFEVHTPITDGSQEISLNWHSPFEGSGTESTIPTLSSMLQSGALSPDVAALAAKISAEHGDGAIELLRNAAGRTGITKLNSTQIFSGMPPVKFSFTAHFRALTDPQSEVRDPITQLEQWAVPQVLANDGIIAGALKNGLRNLGLETIFPSVAPQLLAMRYGDQTILPIVIESMSKPITVPRSSKGEVLNVAVQMTVATLTAIDRRDVAGFYNG
ncbi:hypothetical protein [Paraburkholderia hospita]|uniref:hypothetical protein n=1 Tax=Paraburkholderia hospita TaxID=169430 RepID=UPI000DEF1FFF|nr:hypothetical protein [Paraburkholderia hospita]AXE97737.1 hypothetical protein CUJ88_04025 [Paraburkholderia hospita]